MVNTTVQNYYNINGTTSMGYSLDSFDNINSKSDKVRPVLMYTNNEAEKGRVQDKYKVYELTSGYLGPFTEY